MKRVEAIKLKFIESQRLYSDGESLFEKRDLWMFKSVYRKRYEVTPGTSASMAMIIESQQEKSHKGCKT